VQASLIDNRDGTQAWQVTLTDPTYKNNPLVCPVTFRSDDYAKIEVLYHEMVERWLVRVTGYQKTISWSLP
jgi:hypothetical protein